MAHALSGGGKAIFNAGVIANRKRQRRRERKQEAKKLAQARLAPEPKYHYGMGSEFYLTREWRKARWSVLVESDGKCAMCGRGRLDNVLLHVDHKVSRSVAPHLELQRDNLQVLCDDCNLGKGATSWSPVQKSGIRKPK